MKFKSKAWPEVSAGSKTLEKKAVVPNMTMSLQEIIDRFTRGEPLEIGRDGNYSDGDDDLEKVGHMDLVDRDEFIERQREIQKRYTEQEKRKEAKRQEELDRLAVEKLLAEKKAADIGQATAVQPAK